jgi:hypothetical protein
MMKGRTVMDRRKLARFAVEALRKLPHARLYALTAEAKDALACLAAAIKQDREARNLSDDDEPTAQSQMVALLERLAKAGVNLQQVRPEVEAKPLPKPWNHPLTGQPLGVPKTPDERAILAKADPLLLDLLDQLEERPYATAFKLREAEAKHKAMAAMPYGETEHLVNPWRTGSGLCQDEVVRHGPPELVAFYQREAADVSVPLFGQTRNITVLGKVARDDPDSYKLIESAQHIHEDWRNQDRLAAEEQRTQAELALKRLETVV